MNQKYFLTQKQIREIVSRHGGFRKYKYHPRAHSNYGNIILCEKKNEHLWLCLRRWNGKNEITKCNEKGVIIYREYF